MAMRTKNIIHQITINIDKYNYKLIECSVFQIYNALHKKPTRVIKLKFQGQRTRTNK